MSERKYTKAFNDWYSRAETIQHLDHWQSSRMKWLCFKAWQKGRQVMKKEQANE